MPKPAGAGRRLGALRRRWRLVVLTALLTLVVAVIWSVSRPPIYEATASVLVSPVATPSDRGTAGQLPNMRDEQQVARSPLVARIVVERFGSSATPEQLLRHVAVEVPGGSRILHITYADRVRFTARTGADAFAAAYLAYRKDAVAAQVQSLVANLTRQIADLTAKKQDQDAVLAPARQATPSQRDAALTLREAYIRQIADLQQQRRVLQGASSVDPGSVIQPARLPGRSLPDPLLNAALGLAVGLLLGVALALVYDRVDRRLRGRDDLAELLDRPVLTPIPPLAPALRAGPPVPGAGDAGAAGQPRRRGVPDTPDQGGVPGQPAPGHLHHGHQRRTGRGQEHRRGEPGAGTGRDRARRPAHLR
jgi:uncharacterized protein involved in exopolysaccharide biosynthesis